MDFIKLVVRQPVTVAVGVIITLIAGILSVQRIPVQRPVRVDERDDVVGVGRA